MQQDSIDVLSHPSVVPAAEKYVAGDAFSRISRNFAHHLLAPVALLAIGAVFCSVARAQTAHFSGYESTLPVNEPSPTAFVAIAVDASGNVYISDFDNDQVVKETPTATGYTQTVVASSASGLVSPRGIAVDGSGNVYVADYGGQQLYKIPWSGSSYGTPVPLLPFVTYSPVDVAVDQLGYAFFTSWGSANVYAVSTTGGSVLTQTQFTGLSQPLGLAWQQIGPSTGNLFVSDYNLGEVVESQWTGSVWTAAVQVPTSGLTTPTRVAVDSSGDLYIADLGNNRVVEVPWNGSAWQPQITVRTSTLNQPQAVAVDGSGNVYVADFGNQRILKETFVGGSFNFDTIAVGTTSSAVGLYFTFDTAGTLGSTAVLTQGASGLDFANANTGTCAAGTPYNSGETCTVNVTFTPKFAGLRAGAAVLKNSSGNVIATAYVYGLGSGPQVAFTPGTTSTLIGGGLSGPSGDAVDGTGNFYIVDNGHSQVVELPVSGETYGVPTPIVTGLSDPRGIAVDGAGNLFIAEYASGTVVEAPAGCTTAGCLVNLPNTNLVNPRGVTVDGQGNVFVSDDGTGGIFEIARTGSGYVLPANVVSGLNQPGFLSVDASGNLYIADSGNNSVVEAPWTSAGYTGIQSLISAGLNQPIGVAVDAAGDLYISDYGDSRVVEAPLGCSTAPCLVTLVAVTASEPSFGPTGIALDGAGNLYISDYGDNLALKLDLADAPSLSFAATIVTQKSTDSPQTVTVDNIGNLNLLFEGSSPDPSYPFDFPMDPADTCSALTQLIPGGSCNLSADFIPMQAGNLSEDLLLTDNNLNAAGPSYATQSIKLNGQGLPQPTVLVAPSSVPFSGQVQGTTSNYWTLTLNNTSGTPVTGIDITIVGTNPSNFAQTSTCGTTLAPYTTCNIQVTFTPTITGDASDYYSATLQIADDAVGNPQTVPLTGTGTAMNAFLSPSYVSFGTQTVGAASPPQTVILANASSGTLTITNIAIATTAPNSSNAFAISSTTCGALPGAYGGALSPSWTLGPNTNCTITMTFTPSAPTSYAGTLTVTDNGLGGTQTVALSGTGAGQNVFLSPTTINFGNQTVGSTSNAWTVTFNNTSNLAVTGVGVSIGGANPLDFGETTTCGTTLAANSTCNIMVTFNPNSAAYFTGTLLVANSAGTQTAYLSGTGTEATAVIAPSQLNFGSQTQNTTSAAQIATLTNTSGGPLTLSGFSITSGSADFSISSTTCSTATPLAAYSTCTFSVVFQPQGAASYTGTLSVTDFGANSPLTVSLVGTGTSNAVSAFFSPSSINFGNQTAGSTSNAWGVTLNNTSSVAITGLNIATGSANFTISSTTCGNSLAANSTCSLQLTFTPQTQGTLTGALTAAYSSGSLSAPLAGTGIAPTVSIAPNPLTFGNQIQSTQSTAQAVTFTNTSAGPVTITGVSVGGNANDFTPTNNCPAPLAANTSCSISVVFNPQGTGNFTGVLYVFDNAGNGTQSVTLTGTGTSNVPSGYFSPASINFGNQTLQSTSNAWGMTLNNNGSVALSNLSVVASGDYSIINNACGASLAAGSACGFQVTFTPTATGSRSGAVTASFNNGSGPLSSITANLTGTGTAPTVSVAPGSLNFGNVTYGSQSSDQYVTLTNTSAGPISSITYGAGGGPFYIDTGAGNCGTSLAANTSCSIYVYFKPSTATGYNGSLTISDNAAGGVQTVSLSGTGQLESQTISFTPLTTPVTFGQGPFGLTATATSGLTVTFSVVSGPATVSSNSLTITGAGTVVVAANQAGNADYSAAPQVTQTLIVNKATPSVTWPTASGITYGQPLSSSTLSGGSASAVISSISVSVPGTFAWTTSGTIPGTPSDAESVTFTPTDTADYNTVTASVNVSVGLATPSIALTCSPNPVTYQAGASQTATCTATVNGLAGATQPTGSVTLYWNSNLWGSPALVGGSASITGFNGLTAGSYTITAQYTGDSNYSPSTTATFNEVISKAAPVIAWAAPAAITYGTALSGSQLNAAASVSGTFSYSPVAGTVLGAGTNTLSVTFTPADTTDYTGATASVNINVSQATPVITWASPAAITYGTALGGTQLDATAGGVSGSFVYSPGAGTVLTAGTHTLSVTFTPTDNTDYTGATGSVNISVSQATITITWAPPAAITYGTALSGTQLNASAGGVNGSFEYTPGAGTVLTAGTHTLSATFYPADTTDYTTPPAASVQITVNPATPTIYWSTPAAITYGTALSGAQLNASASVGGSFSYSPGAGTVLGAGPQTLSATFTPYDSNDYSTVNTQVTLTVNKATPTMSVTCSPNPVTYTAGTQTATCTATVGGGATGTVAMYWDGNYWGSPALSGGSAFLTGFNGLNPGNYSILAVYSGDANNNTTNASTTEVIIDPSLSDTIVTPNYMLTSTPSTLTVQAGQSGTVAFAFLPAIGYQGTVTLSCANLPDGVSCDFLPPTVTADGKGTVQTSQLTITTAGAGQSAASANRVRNAPAGTALAGILLLPGLFFGGLLAWRRRKLSSWTKQLLVAGILASTLAGFSGCGGALFLSEEAGTHTITITAKATAGGATTTQTEVLTLTIAP